MAKKKKSQADNTSVNATVYKGPIHMYILNPIPAEEFLKAMKNGKVKCQKKGSR